MTALFADRGAASGMLVTVDGPNGSGKTTLADAVAVALSGAGIEVHLTKQPSPTPLGDHVRASERAIGGRALACLVAADRHHQAQKEIVPALKRGAVVLCDRYIESSLVLQRIDGVDVDFVLAINAGIPRPDVRIRLMASEEALRERLRLRPTDPARRFEQAPDGPARELELYREADDLLEQRYGLDVHLVDTTRTEAGALGRKVAAVILGRWA